MRGLGSGLGFPRGLGDGLSPVRRGGWSPVAAFGANLKALYDPSDLGTMFQDSAGTTAAVVDSPVGLLLDKSQWGGKTLAQVIAAATELWIHASVSVVGESQILGVQSYRVYSSAGTASEVGVSGAVNTTDTYEVSFTIDAVVSGSIQVGNLGPTYNTTGAKRCLTRWNTTGALFKRVSGATDVTISNVSVKAIPGNHAFQATSASRPMLRRVPNPSAAAMAAQPELIVNGTFDTDLSGWTDASSAPSTVIWSGGQAVWQTDGVNNARVRQSFTTVIGKTYRVTKTGSSNNFYAISTATGGVDVLPYSPDATRYFVATSATTWFNTANSTNGSTMDNVSVKEVPADAPLLYYLDFDGSDDGLATSSFAWGSDEAFVCVGMRKDSDAARGMLLETSVLSGANTGALSLEAPTAASASLSFISRGSATAISSYTNAAVAAPWLGVATGIAKIGTDVAKLRANGAEVSNVSTDQGSGNFGTYPLYIGRRAGTSLPFDGRFYYGILVNRLPTDPERAQAERLVGTKTGVTL